MSTTIFTRYPIEPALELPISDARNHFADLVSSAHDLGHITYVTRRGRRLAAVVPAHLAEQADRAADQADVTAAEAVVAGLDSGSDALDWATVRGRMVPS